MNFKILCPNLSSSVENKGNLHKIKLITFQVQYIYIMNEIFNFLEFYMSIYQGERIGKNEFSIGRNEILSPLGILCIRQNICP